MKVAIYLRTSTKEQHPENQKEECVRFANNRGYQIEGIYLEHISGFKDVERTKYDEIKQKAFRGEINGVVVWALDRWVRNRDTLLEDVIALNQYGCKLHSVKEAWLEAINIDGSIGKTIREFLLGLVGSIAEMESQRRSERVKIAYARYENDNRKYKRWGRKQLPQRVIDEVLVLNKEGLSLRDIAKRVSYFDKNNKPKLLSVGSVHKIISKKSI